MDKTHSIFLKYVRNNKSSGISSQLWKTGGRLIINQNGFVLRTFGKRVVFDKHCSVYREQKEELLHSVIITITDKNNSYSVMLSPRKFRKLMELTKQ